MRDSVKIALIFAGAIIFIFGVHLYFSPYQSCVRAGFEEIESADNAAEYADPRIWCSRNSR